LPSPRNWATPCESHGCRAAPVRRRLTLVRISSLPVTGGLPLSISFSTSCPEQDSGVRISNHRILKAKCNCKEES
jgi:hypothetical protein